MILKDISFPTPQENILFDDVLLSLAETGESAEVLRFWESADYFIVLGKMGAATKDIKWDAVHREGIFVLRRSSGGGTVVQGKGCLNYSLVLAKEKHPQLSTIPQSYRFILGRIVDVLNDLKVAAVFKPISDIAIADGERKFSGNAQRRSKRFILHHGTILYDFELVKIEDFLKLPEDIPVYRCSRSHRDFLTNINICPEAFKKRCAQNFGVTDAESKPKEVERVCLQRFLKTKDIIVTA